MGVRFPDGRAVFGCRLQAPVAARLLASVEASGEYVAAHWRELLIEEPELAQFAIMYDLDYPNLNGRSMRIPMVAADVPANIPVASVHPVAVWSGDDAETFDDVMDRAIALIPAAFEDDGSAASVDLDQHHVYFITKMFACS